MSWLLVFSAPALLLGSFCIDLYISSVPFVSLDFQSSSMMTQLTLTLPMLMMGLSQIAWGRSADYIGLRKTLFIALTFFFIGSILCLISPYISVFLIGRVFQGIGACGGRLYAIQLIRSKTTGDESAQALGYLMSIGGVVPIFAPFLILFIVYLIDDWRGIFVFLILYSGALGSIFFHALKKPFSPLAQEIISGPSASQGLLSDIQKITSNKDFKKFALIPSLLMLGFSLFIYFSTYYVQKGHRIDGVYFQIILSTHTLLFALSSFYLPRFISHDADLRITDGLMALLCLYLFLFFTNFFTYISIFLYLFCTFFMAIIYGGLYGPCINSAMRSITSNQGLAVALIGTFQYVIVSTISTLYVVFNLLSMTTFLMPLVFLSLCCIFMVFIDDPRSLNRYHLSQKSNILKNFMQKLRKYTKSV
jgi:DHA1 family bicyclomycin/chloramphenicol resistance-like MFS transporter